MNALKRQTSYLLANIIDKGGIFLSLPLLARGLTKSEFGVVSNLGPIILLCSLLATASIQAAASRFYNEAKSKEYHSFTLFLIIITGHLFLCSILILIFFLELDSNLDSKFLFLLFLSTFLYSIYEVRLILLQMQDSISVILLASASKALIFLLAIYIFFSIQIISIENYLICFCLAYLFGIILSIRREELKLVDHKYYDKQKIYSYLKYSFTILPHNLSSMGNQYIDRVFVAYLLGTTSLGGYSLAAQISLTLSVLNNSLNKSFLRQTLKAFDGRKVKSLFNIANCHVTIVSIAATCISIWAEKIVEFMSGGGYEDSIYILIILTVHQVASSVYLKLCGPLYYFKEKSHYLFRISAAVFILNSISTIMLIKAYGLIGASIGAVISVVFVLFVIHKINMRFFNLCFPVKSYFCMILIPLILGLLSYWVGMILLSWIMMISYALGAFFFFWRDMDAIYIKQKI